MNKKDLKIYAHSDLLSMLVMCGRLAFDPSDDIQCTYAGQFDGTPIYCDVNAHFEHKDDGSISFNVLIESPHGKNTLFFAARPEGRWLGEQCESLANWLNECIEALLVSVDFIPNQSDVTALLDLVNDIRNESPVPTVQETFNSDSEGSVDSSVVLS